MALWLRGVSAVACMGVRVEAMVNDAGLHLGVVLPRYGREQERGGDDVRRGNY